jgi:hypothetical protein
MMDRRMARFWGVFSAGAILFAAGFMPWTQVSLEAWLERALGRTFQRLEEDVRRVDEEFEASRIRAEEFARQAGGDQPSPDAAAAADRLRSPFEELAGSMVRGRGGQIRFTAWETELEPLDIGLPNWIVPVIGLACAILAVVTLKGWLAVPWQLPFGLALYALVHAAVFAVHAGRSGFLSGLGLTLASALAMLVASWPAAGRAGPVPIASRES